MLGDDADDVALLDRRVEAEQQIGRGKVEEVQGVRLEDLTVVHQPAHLLAGRRQPVDAEDAVDRLGGAQVVADRADAAQTLHQHRHFPERAALDEAFETPELDDVQAGAQTRLAFVEEDGDLAVSLDAGDAVRSRCACWRGYPWDLLSASVVLEQLVGQLGRLAREQRGECSPERVGRGWTARKVGVDLDDFVSGADLVEQQRDLLVVRDPTARIVDARAGRRRPPAGTPRAAPCCAAPERRR